MREDDTKRQQKLPYLLAELPELSSATGRHQNSGITAANEARVLVAWRGGSGGLGFGEVGKAGGNDP
jgi:hypothetical protein